MSAKRSGGSGPQELHDAARSRQGGPEPPSSIEMSAVQSSSVAQLGFDHRREELHVQFRTSDNIYIYEGVSPDVYAELLESDSKGAFLNTRIKTVYPFRVRATP